MADATKRSTPATVVGVSNTENCKHILQRDSTNDWAHIL